jgi:Flp pilus assembly protein TadD
MKYLLFATNILRDLMKEDWFFWGRWSKREKIPFLSFIFLLLLLGGYALYAKYRGMALVIHWDVITELKEKLVQTPALFLDKFAFSASTPLWYVTEYYSPSLLQVPAHVPYLFLGALLLGVSGILAGLSRLRGVWFFVGALVLGMVVMLMHLESLFLSAKNWPFLLGFALVGGTYYSTNVWARQLDASKTMALWVVVWGVFLWAVHAFSLVNLPLLSLSSYGLSAGVLLTALFIFLTAHEIPAALFSLVSSRSQKGKSSLAEAVIMSVVFIFNAVLVYLENAKRLEGGSYVPPAVLLFLLNTVLGLWGFRHMSEQRGWFSYSGVGAWIYLGFATVSVGTVGFAYGSYNTPLIEFLEDFISIAVVGAGTVFLLHVLLNFWPLMKAGLPFQKVLHKPPFTPFVLARIAGVFVMFFLFSFKNMYSYFQLRAGLDNAIADFYEEEGDFRAAETYYKSAAQFDVSNLRSNLSLASLAVKANDGVTAAFYYRQAGQREPNLASILGLSRFMESQDFYFDAVFQLKEGLTHFPNEAKLFTNLARLQAQAGLVDSVLLNYDMALNLQPKGAVETSNYLAFWIENGKPEKLEEILSGIPTVKGYSVEANRAALARLSGLEMDFSAFDLPKDSLLDVSRAAYLFNAMSNPATKNSSVKGEDLRAIQRHNEAFYEPLSWAYALQKYYREDKLEGIKALQFLGDSPSKMGAIYRQNLGLWLMNEGAYSKALASLNAAGDSTSVLLLQKADLRMRIDSSLRVQAESLKADLDASKAPLNPYFLVKVAKNLDQKGKKLEAYNLLFYALDFQGDSPLLLEAYIRQAIALSMLEYAENGLTRGKSILEPGLYRELQDTIEEKRRLTKF